MERGIFITLEGIEGAGKSTSMQFIADVLIKQGHEVILTREPGGTTLGEKIRVILLDNCNPALSHHAELLLVFAARAQHIEEIIKPSLAAGKIVLCDRFTDSSYAYQGAGRGIHHQNIQNIENWVQMDLQPHLTFLFDIDVYAGLKRIKKRHHTDRFEQEEVDFFYRARQCYLQRAQDEIERFHIIDAEKTSEQIKQQILFVLRKKRLC